MFIDFYMDEVLEILSQKMDCTDITKDEIIEMVPTSIDRKILNDFYIKTGLNVGHYYNDQAGERTLLFDRLGAYPIWDMGSGAYLNPSGEYAAVGGDIDCPVDVIIEEEVQLISQTDDGNNYIIVPFGVDLFEDEDDCDGDDLDGYNPYKRRTKRGFDYSKYMITIIS